MSPVRAHVGAAAQFARTADVEHAHLVAVFLAEQRHGAQFLGVLDGHDARLGGGVGEDFGVDDVFHAADFLGRHRPHCGRSRSGSCPRSTSEPFCCTWPPSTSRRALCIRWVAEWLRMVRARAWAVHPGASRRCRRSACRSSPRRGGRTRRPGFSACPPRRRCRARLQHAAIADLAAGFGIERRVVEHHHAASRLPVSSLTGAPSLYRASTLPLCFQRVVAVEGRWPGRRIPGWPPS